LVRRLLIAAGARFVALQGKNHIPLEQESTTQRPLGDIDLFLQRWIAARSVTPRAHVVLAIPHKVRARAGRPVEMAVAVVVGFKDRKISHEHIYWDQAGVLVQIGLVDG
jgi:ketosteroid isomerase-like protein